MDRNLGALRVATKSADPDAYGTLYQWGRGGDGHEYRSSPTSSTLSGSDYPGHGSFILTGTLGDWRSPENTISFWQGVSGINNPCPAGFRLPTEAEWTAERLSWSSNDAAGAFNSPLKLVLAGLRDNFDGAVEEVGLSGWYWSDTVTVSSGFGKHLHFNPNTSSVFHSYRAQGSSVRCIKD